MVRRLEAPPGLQAHLAGPVATRVDSNSQSRNTGASVQSFSILFVIVLLALIFRSVLAPLIAVIPSILVVLTAERLTAEVAVHGLQVSQLASLLLVVLVIGAGMDYALFLMFRVREEMRRGLPPREAVATAVARVGESITFSAGTVIAALLSLLAATFSLYSGLGVPLAIGIGLMLVAGLTLLPALLAILQEAAFWPAAVTPGVLRAGWWGRISGRIVHWPMVTLVAGLLAAGWPLHRWATWPGASGGAATAPAGSDSATGNALLAARFPQTSVNPTVIVMRLPRPLWDGPQPVAAAERQLAAGREFSRVAGPLNPNGTVLTPAQYTKLHAALGPTAGLSGTRAVPAAPGGSQAAGR